jgi:hypothetical protein
MEKEAQHDNIEYVKPEKWEMPSIMGFIVSEKHSIFIGRRRTEDLVLSYLLQLLG